MSAALSHEVQEFIRGKVFAHIATLMGDGSPQVTPVWVDTDGQNVVINTAHSRIKTRNMQRDGRVAISIMGLDNPFRTVWVRGTVKEITDAGANDHIDMLSNKYTDNPQYQGHRPDENRVKVIIEPEHIIARGL